MWTTLARTAGRSWSSDGYATLRFDHVLSYLLNTRYWFLEVSTPRIARGMDKILSKHDLETRARLRLLLRQKTVEKHFGSSTTSQCGKSVVVSLSSAATGKVSEWQGSLRAPHRPTRSARVARASSGSASAWHSAAGQDLALLQPSSVVGETASM